MSHQRTLTRYKTPVDWLLKIGYKRKKTSKYFWECPKCDSRYFTNPVIVGFRNGRLEASVGVCSKCLRTCSCGQLKDGEESCSVCGDLRQRITLRRFLMPEDDPTFGVTSTGSTTYPATDLGDTTTEANNTSPSANDLFTTSEFTTTVPYTIIAVIMYQPSSNSGVKCHFGLYPNSGGNAQGQTLVSGSDSGEVSLSASTGWVTYTYTTPFYLPAGTYWPSLLCNASMNMRRATATGAHYGAQTYGALPSTCPTLGSAWYTSSSIYFVGNAIEGYTKGTRVQYTDTTGATVNSFSFYVSNYTSGDKIILSLYDDSGGSPNHRLWYSNISGTDPGGTGWKSINQSSGTTDNSWDGTLTQNAYYWFMWQVNNVNLIPSYASGSANTGIYLVEAFGTLLSTFSGGTLSTENWSMYATYTIGQLVTKSVSSNFGMTSAAATKMVRVRKPSSNFGMSSTIARVRKVLRTVTSVFICGDSNIEPNYNLNANVVQYANRVQITGPLTITAFVIYTKTSASCNMKFGIYPDSGSAPSGPATGKTGSYAVGGSVGWQSVGLSAPDYISIPAGSAYYWLAFCSDTTITDYLGRLGSVSDYFENLAFASAMPTTPNSPAHETAGTYSFYASTSTASLSSFGMSSVLGRKFIARKGPSSNFGLSSSLARILKLKRFPTGNFGMHAAISWRKLWHRTVSSNFGMSSAIAYSLHHFNAMLIANQANMAMQAQVLGVKSTLRTISSNFGMAASVSKARGVARSIQSNFAMSASVAKRAILLRALPGAWQGSSFIMTAALTHAKLSLRSLSSNFGMSSQVLRSHFSPRTVSSSFGMSSSLARHMTAFRTLTSNFAMSASTVLTFIKRHGASLRISVQVNNARQIGVAVKTRMISLRSRTRKTEENKP